MKVHVRKDEVCANVRENALCEGVLFTCLGRMATRDVWRA